MRKIYANLEKGDAAKAVERELSVKKEQKRSKSILQNLRGIRNLSLTLMVILGLISLVGAWRLNGQIGILEKRSLANTQYVWEIRGNLNMVGQYLLVALAESDDAQIAEEMKEIDTLAKRTEEVIALYKTNYRIDKALLDEFLKDFEQIKSYREEIAGNIRLNTQEGNTEAFRLYEAHYIDLLTEANGILKEIDDAQNVIVGANIKNANVVFWTVVVFGIISIAVAVVILTRKNNEMIENIRKPLDAMEKAADSLAQGDFDFEI